MHQYTLQIDGMVCGMCEAHLNDTIRRTAPVKKVFSSHKKGESVILSEAPFDIEAVKAAIAATGYTVRQVAETTVEKKRSLFGK